jgi:hypothetical protein
MNAFAEQTIHFFADSSQDENFRIRILPILTWDAMPPNGNTRNSRKK